MAEHQPEERVMEEYKTKMFNQLLEQIKEKNVIHIDSLSQLEIRDFCYFLLEKKIIAAIVDDFFLHITKKSLLLQAIFYQLKLVNMHSLNWDALEDALQDKINMNSTGLVIIFTEGARIREELAKELVVLESIFRQLKNKNSGIIYAKLRT